LQEVNQRCNSARGTTWPPACGSNVLVPSQYGRQLMFGHIRFWHGVHVLRMTYCNWVGTAPTTDAGATNCQLGFGVWHAHLMSPSSPDSASNGFAWRCRSLVPAGGGCSRQPFVPWLSLFYCNYPPQVATRLRCSANAVPNAVWSLFCEWQMSVVVLDVIRTW
jgi:hypothetical protein